MSLGRALTFTAWAEHNYTFSSTLALGGASLGFDHKVTRLEFAANVALNTTAQTNTVVAVSPSGFTTGFQYGAVGFTPHGGATTPPDNTAWLTFEPDSGNRSLSRDAVVPAASWTPSTLLNQETFNLTRSWRGQLLVPGGADYYVVLSTFNPATYTNIGISWAFRLTYVTV